MNGNEDSLFSALPTLGPSLLQWMAAAAVLFLVPSRSMSFLWRLFLAYVAFKFPLIALAVVPVSRLVKRKPLPGNVAEVIAAQEARKAGERSRPDGADRVLALLKQSAQQGQAGTAPPADPHKDLARLDRSKQPEKPESRGASAAPARPGAASLDIARLTSPDIAVRFENTNNTDRKLNIPKVVQ